MCVNHYKSPNHVSLKVVCFVLRRLLVVSWMLNTCKNKSKFCVCVLAGRLCAVCTWPCSVSVDPGLCLWNGGGCRLHRDTGCSCILFIHCQVSCFDSSSSPHPLKKQNGNKQTFREREKDRK